MLNAKQERHFSDLDHAIYRQVSTAPNQMRIGVPSILQGPFKAGAEGVFRNQGWVVASHIQELASHLILPVILFRKLSLMESGNSPLAAHLCQNPIENTLANGIIRALSRG